MSNELTAPKALAKALRESREVKGLSLREAATKAEISATYLSHLEAGEVKEPSPHILHRLAGVYGASYADLMTLAGYFVPAKKDKPQVPSRPLEIALRTSAPLTDDEREALLQYLSWYRFQAKKGRQSDGE